MNLLLVYGLFVVPASFGFAIAWLLTFKRQLLAWPDWLGLVLPWGIWMLLTGFWDEGKSIVNLVEALYLGWAVALLFAVRAVIALRFQVARLPISLAGLVASCATGVALWALVPGLPE